MSQTLQNVLETIKTLSPEELAQLHQEVEKLVQPSVQRVFLENLKLAGLISEIKTPTHRTYTDRADVKGEPVSQTIIEERELASGGWPAGYFKSFGKRKVDIKLED
jgi:hypothetical protein